MINFLKSNFENKTKKKAGLKIKSSSLWLGSFFICFSTSLKILYVVFLFRGQPEMLYGRRSLPAVLVINKFCTKKYKSDLASKSDFRSKDPWRYSSNSSNVKYNSGKFEHICFAGHRLSVKALLIRICFQFHYSLIEWCFSLWFPIR